MIIRLMPWIVIAAIATFISGCQTFKPALFVKKSPHEHYTDKLKASGIDVTAMGRRWLTEAETSLQRVIPISLPYKETGYFAAERVRAVTFSFPVKRGEKLVISLDKNSEDHFTIYTELWKREGNQNRQSFKPLLWMEYPSDSIVFEVESDDTLLLRMQPELLASGSYTLTITKGPSLDYPFGKIGKHDIQSFYGDPRDSGARAHEGIDLFAPKRTPVLAMAEGRITLVNENMRGGKIVWMKPKGKSYTLYYAHLDSQMVKPLQHVNVGDG